MAMVGVDDSSIQTHSLPSRLVALY